MTDKRATVLIVEDNKAMLRLNARMLSGAGHVVLAAETLAEAREQLKSHTPDAVVLDIMLPDGNGLDFLQEIREDSDAPVLLVTSLGDKDDRLAGLRAGGDDYITKPYDIDELVARVNAFLRRERMHREKPVREITKGPLRLDTLSGRAYLNGSEMRLAPKEFSILRLLVQNESSILTAEKLYEEVWGMPMASDDHSIKNAVYRLRKKLRSDSSGLWIEMLRGEGYRFLQI